MNRENLNDYRRENPTAKGKTSILYQGGSGSKFRYHRGRRPIHRGRRRNVEVVVDIY